VKVKWFNQNRNWKYSELECEVIQKKNKSIRTIKYQNQYNVLSILRFNNEIEVKSLETSRQQLLRFQENLPTTEKVYDIFWDKNQLGLYVLLKSGDIIFCLLDWNFDIAATSLINTEYNNLPNLKSISNQTLDIMDILTLNEFISDIGVGERSSISCFYICNTTIIVGTVEGDIRIYKDKRLIECFDRVHESPVTSVKLLEDTTVISFGRDSKVICLKKEGNIWSQYCIGQHTGWIYDCAIEEQKNVIYTAGGDGIVCKFDLKKNETIECIPINKGVISTIVCIGKKDHLIIGGYDGSVLSIRKINSCMNKFHKNSIWNMYSHPEKKLLYTGGSDGKLTCSNALDGNLINSIDTYAGWINGMDYTSNFECLVAVSSEGDVIFWSELDSQVKKVIKLENHWLNNVKVDNDTNYIFLAAAEGDVIVYDLISDKIVKIMSKHCDQVLDIAIDFKRNIVISLSIDGLVCFWDLYNFTLKNEVFLENFHPTSLTIVQFKSEVLIASLEGDIVKIDLDNFTISRLLSVHEGRIWKIAGAINNNLVVTIGTDFKLKVWDSTDLKVEWESDSLLTACLMDQDNIFFANQNGEYGCMETNAIVNSGKAILESDNIRPAENIFLDQVEEELSKRLQKGETIVFINNNHMQLAYVNRVLEILKDLDIEYSIVDVSNKKGIQKLLYTKSGWSHFPQVFFKGKFLGAGSVLLEMHRTNTINRLINLTRQVRV
jgi:WD40 repeat protein/glutaredoxin-related protein